MDIFGGGGDGGGSSTSVTTAQLPPELQALATAQAAQTIGLGQVLPISAFAAQPTPGTAGLSPLQEAAMANALRMGLTPSGLNAMLGMGGPMALATQGMLQLGSAPPALQAAQNSLAPRLGLSSMPETGTETLGAIMAPVAGGQIPVPGPIPSVFGGQTEEDILTQAMTLPTAETPTVFSEYQPKLDVPAAGITPPPPPPVEPPATGGVPTVTVDEFGQVIYTDPATGQKIVLGGQPAISNPGWNTE